MNNKTTGLKSIAYELGISINTVSRALRDCSDISDATKEKVRKKAYELGYLPNNISQFIKRDEKKLIAIIINSLKNPFFTIVCDKLVNLLNEKKYDFTIVYSLTKKLELEVLKQCISQRVDGIVTLIEPTDEVVETAKLNNIPVVIIGRQLNKDYIDEIYLNDELGGQLVANYLANYHSIKKFVYIKISNIECSKRRQRAFLQTLKSIDDSYECIVLEEKQIKTKLLDLINQGYLGVFCFNDELAYQALKILNKDIPNVRKVYPKLHIIGFDCVSTQITGFIDITSISYNYDEICKMGLELIENRFIDNRREKKSIKFTVCLHQRRI